jgi:phosphatidylglycerol---prolipoprotein diacylglyceryl transferase
MYPDLQHIAESIFGSPMPAWLGVIKTFGLFVAIAFLVASYVLVAELKRKEKKGLLLPEKQIDRNGVEKIIYPHQRAGNIVMLALIGGIIGAKIFNAFETWQQFLKDPIGNLFSGGGLTFYGGLIVGGGIVVYYLRKHKIDFRHFADAIAPALMLAYGIGRLGCHFSGDGDWGIFNSAYTTLADGSIQLGSLTDFHQALNKSTGYFTDNFGSLDHVRSLFAPGPSWLPHWVMANNYPNNVINEGIKLTHCTGEYCSVLPVAVFPTALYEAFICTLLFGLLWLIRKWFTTPLHLFGLYLILNGIERFYIEKIRVNYKYDWGFLHPTQAEIISTVILLIGIGILFFLKKSPMERKDYSQ